MLNNTITFGTLYSTIHQLFMQTILVAGAGKTSTYLIEYLLNNAPKYNWNVIVADGNADAIAQKIKGNKYAEAAAINITDEAERRVLVKRADIVLSLMPPHLHVLLAEDCIIYKKNIITASYVSAEMKKLDDAAKDAGLMFMCEMGLDPGIDHMTATQIIDDIQNKGGHVTSFKSYAGGLVAPESDDNPWHYKFSWNPNNVVGAGKDGANYLKNNEIVKIPYEEVFKDLGGSGELEGIGELICYPNRDSLKYLEQYDVPGIETFIRGTYRYPGFCKGWSALISLGLTTIDDTIDAINYTTALWLKEKTNYSNTNISLQEHIANTLDIPNDSNTMKLLSWLGLFDEVLIADGTYTSATILLNILKDKWQMKPEDKDMIVMQHEVEYKYQNKPTQLNSTMILIGDNSEYTAMAKTVGLPMAILAKLVLTNEIAILKGVHIPNMPSVYKPVMAELEEHGIIFKEIIK